MHRAAAAGNSQNGGSLRKLQCKKTVELTFENVLSAMHRAAAH